MTNNDAHDLAEFALKLNQTVLQKSENELGPYCQIDIFTKEVISYLDEAAELEEEPNVFPFRKDPDIACNAYCTAENEERLDLFITHYEPTNEIVDLSEKDARAAFDKLKNFYLKATKGFHKELEPESIAFDAAQTIFQLKKVDKLCSVHVFLLTNCRVDAKAPATEKIDGVSVSYQIWDIQKLNRCASSDKKREDIELDLTVSPFHPIKCITEVNSEYTTYMGVIPGKILADIYDLYGPKLLERNVRSFLQARGKVNMRIKDCLTETPKMFLAYNNGISATAASVKVEGGAAALITHINDFQIVNGGQTTASIHNARAKYKADLSAVNVQFKLTVLKKSEQMDEVVPKISEYANSQNKIQAADFAAGDPFHKKIEELSRETWAIPAEGGPSTHWFYERARGQYLDSINRAENPKNFQRSNPKNQMFTKEDLAKFVNALDYHLPHKVSAGGQKNFAEYSIHLRESAPPTLEREYFESLVARAIVFRKTEQLVKENKEFEAYWANIVAYTTSFLSHVISRQSRGFDWKSIWTKQDISPSLHHTLSEVSKIVYKQLLKSAGSKNVTQWCKREECWEQFSDLRYKLSQAFEKELVASRPSQDKNEIRAAIFELLPKNGPIEREELLRKLLSKLGGKRLRQGVKKRFNYTIGSEARAGRLKVNRERNEVRRA